MKVCTCTLVSPEIMQDTSFLLLYRVIHRKGLGAIAVRLIGWLFSDAKTAENSIEHGFGDVFAKDFAEGLGCASKIYCPEVEGELVLDGFFDLFEGDFGAGEGGALALVDGEIEVGGLGFVLMDLLEDCAFEIGDADVFFGDRLDDLGGWGGGE